MKNSNTFMQCKEFFNTLYLALFVINRYHEILGTVPDLTINDIEIIEEETPFYPCAEILIRLPLTFNASVSNEIDSKDVEEFLAECRDNLQEYFDILVNTNREHIRPLRSPNKSMFYNPIFVQSIDAIGYQMGIRIAYVDSPLAYRFMQEALINRSQPNIGLK